MAESGYRIWVLGPNGERLEVTGGGTTTPTPGTTIDGIEDVPGLVAELANKAAFSHRHIEADIDGLTASAPRAQVITVPTTESWAEVEIQDDGSSTASWVNRFQVFFKAVGGIRNLVTWINEYGELRSLPAKTNTVGLRVFAAKDAAGLIARSATTPVMEVTNQRDGTRTTIFAVYSDGATRMGGYKVTIGPTIPTSPESGQIHIITEV